MMTKEQIEYYGRKTMALARQYQNATEHEKNEIEAELEKIYKNIGSRENELKILDWIDQQEWLLDMVRGNTNAFDNHGNYIPVTYRFYED